jgi:glycosyltransferase involved in cell wall biosynthesis
MSHRSICFVLSNSASDFRLTLAARHLQRVGYGVEVFNEILKKAPLYKLMEHDVFVISRPGLEMCDFIKHGISINKQIVVDMDDDLTSVPDGSPAFQITGQERINYVNNLIHVVEMATALTITKPDLSVCYHRNGEVIPNGWDEENTLWQSPKVRWDGISIGWAGTITHRGDFAICLPALRQILSQRKDVRVVIGGDEEIYNLFADVPERQKLYLVSVAYENYPAMYAFWDIAVAPLEDTRFNSKKSDIKLVEAGARGIPWVASPLPQYREWGKGGVFADDWNWYDRLMMLIDDIELRQRLGSIGHTHAMMRTSAVIGKRWEEVIGELIPK